MQLTDFDVLSFDCYGTLIDWETGLYAALQPLLHRTTASLPRDGVLELFARHESAQEALTPGMIYSDLLTQVHRDLARELGVTMPEEAHLQFGASVPDWPAFPDTASSLQYLQKYYKLVILSNVDRKSFAGSNKQLMVKFDAIYTAEDIGSYKPDIANFNYMLEHLAQDGIAPGQILHTAQSLFHDHGPARQVGLASAWIDRRHETGGWGATLPTSDKTYDFRFTSMADMVKAHQEDLRA